MARKKLGHVELEWTCPNCGGLNPGSERTCSNCGSPQPDDVEFHQPTHQELVSDEAKIAQAEAGPDIHCPYCETRNAATNQVCTQCGGDLSEGALREAGKVVGAYQPGEVDEVPCPHCGSLNPETAVTCDNCGGSLVRQPEPQARPQPAPAAPARNPLVMVAIVLGVVLVCGLIGLFLILSLRTTDLTGTVQNVQWERSAPIEAFLPVEYEGWLDEIPGEAAVGNCSEALRSVEDQPVPNSVEVCGTPYTVDTGSGFGEVVQDCTYEVYDNLCTFTVDEWQQVETAVLSGNDFSPVWPSPVLESNQRLGEDTTESFVCVFATDEGTYSYTTQDFNAFLACELGSTWTLNVNSFGGVVSIEK